MSSVRMTFHNKMTTAIDAMIEGGLSIASQLAEKNGLPTIADVGGAFALEKLVNEVDTWKMLFGANSGNIIRVSVACGFVSLATHVMWKVSPVTSAFRCAVDLWNKSVYERELRRQFSIADAGPDEKSTLEMVLEPNTDVEHSYDFIQVEVPHNGGTQLCTYSSLYGGYIVRNEDGHLLAKRLHVYSRETGTSAYEWTYTPIGVLDEVAASEELLRCGATESPILGAEPLVRLEPHKIPFQAYSKSL